jgi:hypothetical protein
MIKRDYCQALVHLTLRIEKFDLELWYDRPRCELWNRDGISDGIAKAAAMELECSRW